MSKIPNHFALLELYNALLSGEYKQGREKLHYKENGEHKYCCLGVGSDLIIKKDPDAYWEESNISIDGRVGYLRVHKKEQEVNIQEGNWGPLEANYYGLDEFPTVKIPPSLEDKYFAVRGVLDPYWRYKHSVIVVPLTHLNDEVKFSFEEIAECLKFTYSL